MFKWNPWGIQAYTLAQSVAVAIEANAVGSNHRPDI